MMLSIVSGVSFGIESWEDLLEKGILAFYDRSEEFNLLGHV